MTPDIDWQLIDRDLAGAATPDDARAIEAWLAADPARRAWLDALRERVHAGETRWDVDSAWARVADRTTRAPAAPRVLPLRATPTAPRRWSWVARAAAVVLVVAGAAYWWRSTPARPAVVAESPMREVAATRGGRAEVRLIDGTRVVLNAGSRLRYAADHGARGRDVWLDGEGYFEVKHDAARPFRVHARGGVAEDLGTRFVVRAYPELREVEVMVAEGVVALRRDDGTARDSAVLRAGQLGSLADDGRVRVDEARADRYLAWTEGTLVLDDMPLTDALPLLARRYDLTLRVADESLGARRVVGRFRDQSASEVLDAIALALGARYERVGRAVTFRAGTR
jgi:transmembrane sensor